MSLLVFMTRLPSLTVKIIRSRKRLALVPTASSAMLTFSQPNVVTRSMICFFNNTFNNGRNPFNLLKLISPNQNYLPTYLLISKEAVYNFSQIFTVLKYKVYKFFQILVHPPGILNIDCEFKPKDYLENGQRISLYEVFVKK